MTPYAGQGATLEENSEPYPRPVVYRVALYVKYVAHKIPNNIVDD